MLNDIVIMVAVLWLYGSTRLYLWEIHSLILPSDKRMLQMELTSVGIFV